MQKNEFEQVNVLIPVPIDAVALSGILEAPIVKITARKGKLIIEEINGNEDFEKDLER